MAVNQFRKTSDLPSRDQTLFRQVVKLNDSKQYKKAIKNVDQLLARYPEHGESNSIKALCLSYLGTQHREEYMRLSKLGVRYDMKSRLAWQILGMIYRQEKDYHESAKAFKFALKAEPENLLILRDLANVQTQGRIFDGLLESRTTLLQHKSQQRVNWLALAVAHYWNDNLEFALGLCHQILSIFHFPADKNISFDAMGASERLEVSELISFMVFLLERQGQYKAALEHLLKHEKMCLNRIEYLNALGRLSMYLGEMQTAKDTYRQLFTQMDEDFNTAISLILCSLSPSSPALSSGFSPIPGPVSTDQSEQSPAPISLLLLNLEGHPSTSNAKGWISTPLHKRFPSFFPHNAEQRHGWKSPSQDHDGGRKVALSKIDSLLSEEAREEILTVISSLITDFPKSKILHYIRLLFSSSSCLVSTPLLSEFLLRNLRRGVASIALSSMCIEIASATSNPTHVLQHIIHLLQHYALSSPLPPPPSSTRPSPPSVSHPLLYSPSDTPEVLVTSLALSSILFDYLLQPQQALLAIDSALYYHPTQVDLYIIKSRIYKHQGALQISSDLIEEARSMDLADKYLNNKSAKAFLRLLDTDTAQSVFTLFPGEPNKKPNMHDNQFLLYENRMARAFHAKGERAKCLRHLQSALEHSEDSKDDVIDFHFYALRRGSAKQYIRFLRHLDGIYSHKDYYENAVLFVTVVLEELKEREKKEKEHQGEEKDEGKKEKKKNKKEKHAPVAQVDIPPLPKKSERDLNGEEFIHSDLLSYAQNVVKNVQGVENLKVQMMCAEFYLCQGHLFLAMKHINRGLEISGGGIGHCLILPVVVKLFGLIEKKGEESGLEKEVMNAALERYAKMLGEERKGEEKWGDLGRRVAKRAGEITKKENEKMNGQRLNMCVSNMRVHLAAFGDLESFSLDTLPKEFDIERDTWESVKEYLTALKAFGVCEKFVEDVKNGVAVAFPYADVCRSTPLSLKPEATY